MSVAQQPSLQDRRESPNLAINLSSNNPFRRTASPGGSSPNTPTAAAPPDGSRPVITTNPFLDTYRLPPQRPPPPPQPDTQQQQQRTRPMSPRKDAPPPAYEAIARERARNASPAQMMNDMSLSEQPSGSAVAAAAPPQRLQPRSGTMPVNGHRIARSQEEELRAIRRPPREKPRPEMDPFASPIKENRMPRRNSDTSVMEAKDEERRQDSRRPKDREGKEPRNQSGSRPRRDRPSRSQKPMAGLDLIDKLDVTGFYGQGTFHHDGPFDACNPHRNKKGRRHAPMQAFPEGSANNIMGGSGPVKNNIDMDAFYGRTAQGFTDYNHSKIGSNPPYVAAHPAEAYFSNPQRPDIIDPKAKTEYVHGEESAGLGTSTFLEGTPAPRVNIQRRDSDADGRQLANGGGLQRKRSLAQKIRGISNKPRGGFYPDGSRVTSPEARYEYGENGMATSPPGLAATETQSAGGRTKLYEKNPFFSNAVVEKQAVPSEQEVQAQAQAQAPVTRSRTTSSPNRELVRNTTNESAQETGAENKQPGGLLNRVKSLKGRRPSRPERAERENRA